MNRQSLIWVIILLTACVDKNTIIEGTVDPESFGSDSSWCYLYTTLLNDRYIADSCQLKDHGFSLTSNLSYESDYTLLFPEKRREYIFAMCPGDHLKIQMDSSIRNSTLLAIPESYSTMAYRKVFLTSWDNKKTIDLLSDSLAFMEINSPEYKALKNHILDVQDRQSNEFVELLNDVAVRKSPLACNLVVMFAEHGGLDSDTVDSLKNMLLQRFPNDRQVLYVCMTADEIPPTSHQGYVAENRIRRLKNLPPLPEVYEEMPVRLPTDSTYVKPVPYGMGAVVDNRIFECLESASSDLTIRPAPIILIDFWASWCPPCCEGLPDLVALKKRYGNRLSVYTISLDYYADRWNEALEKYAMQDVFINMLLPRGHKDYQYIMDKFDLRMIPRNYLLDKERKIIAIDLRDEELAEKMKELTGQQLSSNRAPR